nr:MAG TPA: holin [Caudoviricetes sp.]
MQEFSVLGLASVSGITVICYLAAEIVKQTPLPNKWLPSICGLLGGLLGIAGLYLVADYPAADGLTAVAVGIVSGLAATGANQLGRQLKN